MTEAEETSYLEPAASPDQEPGAARVRATSDPLVVPLHLEGVERSSLGTERGASAGPETWASMPGMPPGAAQEGLEPGGGKDLLGGPQPRRGEGQPAAREGKAAAQPLAAPESGGGEGKAEPPLVGEPPSKEGACGAEEAAGREGAQWGHTVGLWKESARRLNAGEGPALECAGHKWEEREPGRSGGERRSR